MSRMALFALAFLPATAVAAPGGTKTPGARTATCSPTTQTIESRLKCPAGQEGSIHVLSVCTTEYYYSADHGGCVALRTDCEEVERTETCKPVETQTDGVRSR